VADYFIGGLGLCFIILGLFMIWQGLKSKANEDLLKVPEKKQKVR